MNKKIIAVYGTLRKNFGNHHYLRNSVFIGKGRTIDKYIMVGRGIPFVSRKKEQDRIVVEVYEVDVESELPSIDGLEGHPTFYKREPIEIELDDSQVVTAELYFCDNVNIEQDIIKDGDYSNLIKKW